VTVANLAEVNAAIDALVAAEVDTLDEIQAVVDQVLALNIIEAYADVGVTAPTLDDFATAGVIGVTVDNLADVNVAIEALAAADVDSLVEVQAIVDELVTVSVTTEILEDSISVGGSGNADGESVSLEALASLPGLNNLYDDYIAAYQQAIADEADFSNLPLLSEVQDLVDEVNTTEGLLAILEDSSSPGGSMNADGDAVVSAQLALIDGLVDVETYASASYAAAIAAETDFSNPPLLSEVQALVDEVGLLDSDSDGISDATEMITDLTGMLDSDGDGIPNILDTDSDNDGILDAVEVGLDVNIPIDSDGDGIPDYVDIDDDSDNDGVPDSTECPSYPDDCPDSDGDNIPDYMDNTNNSEVNPNYKKVRTGQNGAGSSSTVFLLSLASLALLRVKRTTMLVVMSFFLLSSAVYADDFDSTWFVGGNLGLSELDPDVDGSGYTREDDTDTGYEIFAGYDFNKHISAQVFYTDFGSAKLDSNNNPGLIEEAEVEYEAFGASALWYFWRHSDSYDYRRGWQAYIDVGLSTMDNDTEIRHQQENHTHLHFGASIEYGWDSLWAVRAGFKTYDEDVSMITLGILKRFGRAEKKQAPPVVEEPVKQPEPEPEPVVVVMDDDKDGVENSADYCPYTRQNARVDENGCSEFQKLLNGVNFDPRSSDIKPESEPILQAAVEKVKAMKSVNIEINAHTDSVGRDDYNMGLSAERANSVRDYFIANGIDERRLFIHAYGETRPIADNNTKEGRAKNRRVDLNIMED
jgi:OOP family OmpA-OmpF porin